MSTTSNIFQPPEPYSYTSAMDPLTDQSQFSQYSAVPAPPAGLHPQQAHLRQTHRMPIRGSFHIATGAAFHTAENDTEAALQGPSARFETNDGYVDVRVGCRRVCRFTMLNPLQVWVSGGSGIATVEASSKSGRVKVEVVDCPSRLPLRLQAKSQKGPVEVLLPPCFVSRCNHPTMAHTNVNSLVCSLRMPKLSTYQKALKRERPASSALQIVSL